MKALNASSVRSGPRGRFTMFSSRVVSQSARASASCDTSIICSARVRVKDAEWVVVRFKYFPVLSMPVTWRSCGAPKFVRRSKSLVLSTQICQIRRFIGPIVNAMRTAASSSHAAMPPKIGPGTYCDSVTHSRCLAAHRSSAHFLSLASRRSYGFNEVVACRSRAGILATLKS